MQGASGGSAAPARRRAAVLGHPIGHSKSPLLHRAAYGLIGFDCSYEAIDVTEEALPGFVRGLRSEAGWAGLSVTMPLKSAMVAQVDRTSELVQVLGVLNTVVAEYDDGGKVTLSGHNTDVAGIVGALRHAGVRDSGRALILGGGGTAAAAAAALAQVEAASAVVCLRDPGKASGVAKVAAHFGLPLDVRGWDEAPAALADAVTVVSTLPPHGSDGLAAQLAQAPAQRSGRVLLDVAYDPWPSAIAAEWQRQGGSVVPGLEMLIYQAVEQVRLFAGTSFKNAAEVTNVMCDAVGAPRR